jgi:hypothetical protein
LVQTHRPPPPPQAGLTLLGNTTVAIAALRIALSNGFDFKALLPGQASDAAEPAAPAVAPIKAGEPDSEVRARPGARARNLSRGPARALHPPPRARRAVTPPPRQLALLGKLSGATLVAAYATKYGELALPFPFAPSAALACAMVATPPALLAAYYLQRGSSDADAATAE